MTITIELPEELSARLTAAGVLAVDAGRYALAALVEVADHAEVRAWWDSLAEADREAERLRTGESLAAADAGHSSPADEVYARIRTRSAPGANT